MLFSVVASGADLSFRPCASNRVPRTVAPLVGYKVGHQGGMGANIKRRRERERDRILMRRGFEVCVEESRRNSDRQEDKPGQKEEREKRVVIR